MAPSDHAKTRSRPVKVTEQWFSDRLQQPISIARWGHFGVPVLVFPTAGGDVEEIERNQLVASCWHLIESGRIKLYSVDSVAGQALAASFGTPEYRMWLFNQFHGAVRNEVVPAIRADMGGHDTPIVTAGASIGAFNAVAVLCRYPDQFRAAVGMSGTYRLQQFLQGKFSEDLYYASPIDFLPGLDGPQLDLLRERRVILASGEGAWENIGSSWAMADALGSKGIPNRVDSWGPDWEHDWPTWLRMLPLYLDELC